MKLMILVEEGDTFFSAMRILQGLIKLLNDNRKAFCPCLVELNKKGNSFDIIPAVPNAEIQKRKPPKKANKRRAV